MGTRQWYTRKQNKVTPPAFAPNAQKVYPVISVADNKKSDAIIVNAKQRD